MILGSSFKAKNCSAVIMSAFLVSEARTCMTSL
jgi:hypothetical protein